MLILDSNVCFKLSSTSVYPAKGRPGSGTTKLDSGAQKRLRRSRIEGCGPCPQACTRFCLCHRRAREVGLQAIAQFGARGPCGLSQNRPFRPVSQFLHIKGLNFPDVFIRSRLPMTPMNHEKFHGNQSACF